MKTLTQMQGTVGAEAEGSAAVVRMQLLRSQKSVQLQTAPNLNT